MRPSPLCILSLLTGCTSEPSLGGQEGSEYTESDVDTDTDTDTDTDSDADTDTDTDTDTDIPNPYELYQGTETYTFHEGPDTPKGDYQCVLTLTVEGEPLPSLPGWCGPDCRLAFDVAVVSVDGDDAPDCDAERLGLSAVEGVYAFQQDAGLWFLPASGGSPAVVDVGVSFVGGVLEYRIEEGDDPATTDVDPGAVYRLREGTITVE